MNNRMRIFTRYLIFLLLDWVMISMWQLIYQSGYGPTSISVTDMSWYMAFSQMMFFLSPRLFVIIDDDVRSGNIGYFLNRPMPYLWMRFSEGFGALCGNFVIYYSISLPFIYLMIGDWPSCGAEGIILVLIGLIFGSTLHLLFQICSGLSAFWSNDAIFIYHSYQKFVLLLGGVYVPLAIYPDYIPETVLQLLPFASLVGNPVSLMFDHSLGNVAEVIGLQIFWIIIACFGLSALYQLCLKKVEVHGG